MINYKTFLENEETAETFDAEHFKKELSLLIDKFLADLKASLTSAPANAGGNTGFFDKIKNWWTNLRYGKDNTSNPNYWKNRFGELGKNESLSMEEYFLIKEFSEKLETVDILEDNNQNIRLFKIIDDWGNRFKTGLLDIVSKMEIQAGTTPEAPVASTPSKAPEAPADSSKVPNKNVGINTPSIANNLQQQMSDEESIEPHDADGKSWKELSIAERKRWNRIGGGILRIKSKIYEDDVGNELPYILRIGDPRIKTLEKFHLRLHNRLLRLGRIESYSNPIETKNELDQRINKVKENIKNARDDIDEKTRLAQNLDQERAKMTGDSELNKEQIASELEAFQDDPGYLAAKDALDSGNLLTAKRFLDSKKRKGRGRPPKGQEFKFQPAEGTKEADLMKALNDLHLAPDEHKKFVKDLADGKIAKVEKDIKNIKLANSQEFDPPPDHNPFPVFETTLADKINYYKAKLIFRD